MDNGLCNNINGLYQITTKPRVILSLPYPQEPLFSNVRIEPAALTTFVVLTPPPVEFVRVCAHPHRDFYPYAFPALLDNFKLISAPSDVR